MLGRIVIAVVLTAVLVGGVSRATLATLRSQNRGTQLSSAADLQDAGSIQRLGVALSSTGGTVVRILPDGVIVQPHRARGTLQRIIFLRGAVLLQRKAPTTAAAIELGAHLSVIGQAGANRSAPFAATKIWISPHRHAIGGIILYISSDGHLTLQNTRLHAVYLVKVLPTTPITTGIGTVSTANLPGASNTSSAGAREPWSVLRLGQHVQVLAVHNPDPQQQDTYLADVIHVVRRRVSIHVGGLLRSIDPRSNTVTIYARLQNQTYSVAVSRSTLTSLSRWPAGYADMFPGDHLTVSGYVDTAALTGSTPDHIVARRIRIGSPSFAGVVVGLAARPDGAVVLDVRPRGRRSHLLRVVAPGRAAVVYATNPARVLDLVVGERISARGTRTGKFALLASSIHVYPRLHTVGGTVTSVIPGAYRIVSATNGAAYVVRTTSQTVYTADQTLTGSTRPIIAVGMRVRARGYDALHNDQRGLPRLIASHITILARHHSSRRGLKSSAAPRASGLVKSQGERRKDAHPGSAGLWPVPASAQGRAGRPRSQDDFARTLPGASPARPPGPVQATSASPRGEHSGTPGRSYLAAW